MLEGIIRGNGNLTVLGGTGIFENATGTVTFTQENRINPAAPTDTAVGLATLNFSLRTPQPVPEPTGANTMFGIGAIGAVFLLRRHYRRTKI